MKRGSTLFLKIALLVLGLGALAASVSIIPAIMGNDDGLAFYNPILYGVYLTTIPFYIALFQSWKLLRYIDHNQAFSEASVKALKKIKYCALTIMTIYLIGMPFIYNAADKDDAPGVMVIGLVFMGASLTIAVFAALLEQLLRNAIDIKSENDLTV